MPWYGSKACKKKKLLSFTINKDHTYKLQHEHLLKKKYQPDVYLKRVR